VPGKQKRGEKASVRAPQRAKLWRWLLLVGVALLFAGGVWAHDRVLPEIRAAWPELQARGSERAQEALLWLEFFASITLSVVALSWFTGLLFCLLAALAYLLPRLIHWEARLWPKKRGLPRVRDATLALLRHDRLLGTLLNLLASAGALGVLAAILERPLDYWDLGIQCAIALVMELVVLGAIFREGRIGLFSRRSG
jgi:hypothetical protein